MTSLTIKNNDKIEIWSPTEREEWSPEEKLTVSEHAVKYRKLPPRSAFGSEYKIELTPFAKEPQDDFTDPRVKWIVMLFGVQICKTTSEENMLSYAIDMTPADAGIIVPREEDIKPAANKIRNMINDSPRLARHKLSSPRALQGHIFELDRMNINFLISGSEASLSEKSIPYLFFREPNKFPPFTGREANPLDNAEKRATTFWYSKFVVSSTPKFKKSYADSYYARSNQNKLWLPCPHCGEFSKWRFEQLRIPKGLRDPDEIIKEKNVWYECEICKYRIEEYLKTKIVSQYKWAPLNQIVKPDRSLVYKCEKCGKEYPVQTVEEQKLKKCEKCETKIIIKTKRISGYQGSSLVSPMPGVSWPEIMAKWFTVNTEEGRASGGLMDFANSIMGESWEPEGKQLEASEIRKLTGMFSRQTVPADCIMLVAAADYHKSPSRGIVRIDYEVSGFATGMKNYVIDTGSVPSWEEYDERVFNSPFPWSDGTPNETKPWLRVCCSFEDSGYLPEDVYTHCRRIAGLKGAGLAIPAKGLDGPELKPLRFSDLETATERRQRHKHLKSWYKGMQLMLVDTHYFKNMVSNWAEPSFEEDPLDKDKMKMKAPPLMQTYIEIPSYWATEFTNEKLVPKVDKPAGVWNPVYPGAPTHALDLRVLCAAAAFYKGVQYARRPKGAESPVSVSRSKTTGGFLDGLPEL